MSLFDNLGPKPPVLIEADRLQTRYGAPKALAMIRADLARARRSRRRRLWRLHDELVHRILRAHKIAAETLD